MLRSKRIPTPEKIYDDLRPRREPRIGRWILLIVVVAAALILTSVAWGNEEPSSGNLMFTDASGTPRAALHMHTDVEVSIRGIQAAVTYRQTFKNDSDKWLSGQYVFPLGERSAVTGMQMIIGERRIVASIRERKQARQEYEQAKQEGKQAALSEQQRPNLFTQHVANIAPGQEVEIELQFFEPVDYQNGRFSWRLPTTITPRYIPGPPLLQDQETDHGTGPFAFSSMGWGLPTSQVSDAHLITPFMVERSASFEHPLRISVTIDSGLQLASISAPFHKIHIDHQNNAHQVTLAEGSASMDRDFVLDWTPAAGDAPSVALFTEQRDDGKYVLLMAMPPQPGNATPLPRDIVFVIDTSGSMSGSSIYQARSALLEALARLQPEDRFNVIEFNSQYRSLFNGLEQADQTNQARAQRWVQSLQADGGTNILPALNASFTQFENTERLSQLVFITDGSVGNETEIFNSIHAQLNNARLFTVGIGSAPNSYFMRKAAEFGRGSYTYIGDVSEVSSKMAALFNKLENTLASNIHIQWDTNAEQFPQRIPDLYAGEPLVVSAKVDNFTSLRIEGTTADQPWQQSFDLSSLGGLENDGSVASYWARSKIDALEDAKTRGGNADEIRQQVTQLALSHQLLSPYTSFIAVEQEIVRPIGLQDQDAAVPNLVAAGQTLSSPIMHAQMAYPATASSAEILLWFAFFTATAAAFVQQMRRD